MGLCYKTSKWADSLWAGHVRTSPVAKGIVRDGKAKQDKFNSFAQDLHAKLYFPNEPLKVDGRSAKPPQWAEDLHAKATELGEWSQLRARCQQDGFAAGVATEALLSELVKLVPAQSKEDKRKGREGHEGFPGGAGGQPGDGQGRPGDGEGSGQGEGPTSDNGDLRRKLRKAVRAATKAVDDAEAEIDGLAEAMGLTRPGTSPGENATIDDIDKIRATYKVAKQSPQLQRIAELAGRLERIAASQKRSTVDNAVGAVKGIELSGDIARIIPSELADLNSSIPMLRLAGLSKILDKRALSYKMEGESPQARGPIIMLFDESSSMRNGRETWSKAVGMAILSTATKQKRAWTGIGFSYGINHERTIEPGEATIDDVTQALVRKPSGGTDFDPPLLRACEIIETSKSMHKADIVLITDGEDDVDDATAKRVNKLRNEQGVNVYCIGVGSEASLSSVKCIANATFQVRSLDTNDNEMIAPVVNLD
jgi:uncharacterized protein with von Willebrand factor type A (vWA) domain